MSEQLIRRFVDLLWPKPVEGYFALWEQPGKKSYFYKVNDPELEIGAYALDQAGHQVFFGIGLRRADLGPYQRGKKEDIVALPGFWIDIDVKGVTHRQENLPTNVVDAIKGILQPFDWEPTMVVFSGGGIHAYWLFEEPLLINDGNRAEVERLSLAFQERLAVHAKAQGWHIDMTADTPRIFRPVGTHNRKAPENPVPVQFMGTPGRARYPYSLIAQALKTKAAAVASIVGKGEVIPGTNTAEAGSERVVLGAAAAPAAPLDTRDPGAIVDELRLKMRKCRKQDRLTIYEQILEGEPFAVTGDRDRTLQRVASWIAFLDPVADPEILAEVLEPSLAVMESAEPEGAMTMDDAIDKIARAQADARRKMAIDERAKQSIGKVFQELARSQDRPKPPPLTGLPGASISPAGPTGAPAPALSLVETLKGMGDAAEGGSSGETGRYTPAEMESFREKHERLCGRPVSIEQFKQQWVVSHGETMWVMVNGRYQSPVLRREFAQSAKRDLYYVLPEFDGDGLYYFSHRTAKGDGSFRDKTTEEVLTELSSVARHVVADMSLTDSYYDADTQTFYEAVCPVRRDLVPRFDQTVQTWLELFKEPKLFAWIATITQLNAPSCALFISGPPGVGKSVMANGLARLWHRGGCTRMEDVVGSFNGDVIHCPLVVADEALPEGPNGKPISTKKLRDQISADARSLRRKFMGNVPLRGTVRCMFLANSEKLLDLGDETLGPDSLSAVASRFLHIAATEEPAKFLADLGGRPGGTKNFVDGDVIACHALWLRDNYPVVPASRFLVEGHVSKMHKMLATGSIVGGLVGEWIIRYLQNPKAEVRSTFGVLVGNGEVLVRAVTVVDYWQEYISKTRNSATPSLKKVTEALKGLSPATEAPRRRSPKGQHRYWPLKVDILLGFAEEHGLGDVDEMRALIDKKVDQ